MSYTWKNNKINSSNDYYNISSKRYVKDLTRKDLIFFKISDDIKICGKPEDIKLFKEENFILTYENSHIELPKPIKLKWWQNLFLCCKNIDDNDLELGNFENLTYFGFNNLEGKGKINRIIDGDTFEIIVYIKLENLSKKFEIGRKNELKSSIITKYNQAGFFTKLKVRLNGVDAAEKDTFHGQQAIQFMNQYFRNNNNIVYYKISEENDKYGRNLMSLYLDEEYKNSAVDYLLSLKFETKDLNLKSWNGTPLAKKYDGGKKDSYMESLPKLKNHDIRIE
jgi:endonuclease YncB( thermonuclease family)